MVVDEGPTIEPGRRSLRRWGPLICAVACVVMALSSLLAPWYAISSNLDNWHPVNSTFSIHSTTTFFPGTEYRFLCHVNPANTYAWGPICAATQLTPGGALQPYVGFPTISYPPPPSAVGALYSLTWLLSLLTFGAGTLALTTLIVLFRRQYHDWRAAFAPAIVFAVAGSLAVGLCLGVAVYQPSAVAHDVGPGLLDGGTSGPEGSFWGSCGPVPSTCGSLPAGNATLNDTWGPSYGWYLELAAGGLFLAIALTEFRRAIRLQRTRRPPLAPPSKP